MARILITGASGFVGKETTRELLKESDNEIVGLIRPNTDKSRILEFDKKIEFVEIDLCDISALQKWLSTQSFDVVVHIGALRGGRPEAKENYYLANVEATIVLANYCLANSARLIFCSSVGIFGAIPQQLPAVESTPRQEDNYYHFTKIKSEAIINELTTQGLDSVIIRPAITYGIGDCGFPYTLCKLVDKKLMLLPTQKVKIHMTDVKLLAQAFTFFVSTKDGRGSKYIVADREPLYLDDLVHYISFRIHNRDYLRSRIINSRFFLLGENIARLFKNELFISRFELISKSWYYDVEATYQAIPLESVNTIENFDQVIDWYLETK